MVRMTIEMPEGALAALHKDPRLRDRGDRGISRNEFLEALGRFGVTPFQYGADEILAEAVLE